MCSSADWKYLFVIHMHTLMLVYTCAHVRLHVHEKSSVVGTGRFAEVECLYLYVLDLLHCSVCVCMRVYAGDSLVGVLQIPRVCACKSISIVFCTGHVWL